MRPLASVSIDLDPIPCYYRIHALGEPPAALRDTIARSAVPRFAELFAARDLRATFFVVGEDLDLPGGASPSLLAELAAAGHELGNHSYHHLYDLARKPAEVIAHEIERAHDRIGEVAGVGPLGFRAPGYDLSAAMLDELVRLGYRYDSSVFPAPGYYAAKAAVMAALRLAGRPSGAVLTEPRALAAPIHPYRPREGAPWRRGDAPLVELPVAVTGLARVPAIGTSLLLAPAPVRRHLMRAMRGRPHFNFELHGIDLCDADADGLPPALVARQPDLRVPLARKRRILEEILDELLAHFEVRTLRDASGRLG